MSVGAADIAYIHGDVSAAGVVPSGPEPAYNQTLLDDTGRTGLSLLRCYWSFRQWQWCLATSQKYIF